MFSWTGYCTAFKEIGEKYGPFDLSTIPIGAYEPRYMMEPQHVDPEQAVKIHIDINQSWLLAAFFNSSTSTSNLFFLLFFSSVSTSNKKNLIFFSSAITITTGTCT